MKKFLLGKRCTEIFKTKLKLVNSPCVLIISTIVYGNSANLCNHICNISTKIEEPNMSKGWLLAEILAAEPV